jgi:hypothetical protein
MSKECKGEASVALIVATLLLAGCGDCDTVYTPPLKPEDRHHCATAYYPSSCLYMLGYRSEWVCK